MPLPTITSMEMAIPALKIWQQSLNSALNTPTPPRTPFNFTAAGGAAGATGITLNWEIVKDADGYEIQCSPTGDFSAAAIIATLTSIAATSYFDSTIVTTIKRYYRIRATAGSTNQPHVVKGIWSSPIAATSGSATTTYDQTSGTSGNTGYNRPIY